MPLDVQPLSPLRKAIAFIVLLAFLGASMGLAQYIVVTRKPSANDNEYGLGHADLVIVPPKGFTANPPEMDGVVRTWSGIVNGAARKIERLTLHEEALNHSLKKIPDLLRYSVAKDTVGQLIELLYHLKVDSVVSVDFGGIDADLFIGTDTKGRIGAFTILVPFNDQYMLLIYSGDKESAVSPVPAFNRADSDLIVELCRNSYVTIDGERVVPQKTPATHPAIR